MAQCSNQGEGECPSLPLALPPSLFFLSLPLSHPTITLSLCVSICNPMPPSLSLSLSLPQPLSPLHFERMMDKLERGSGNTVSHTSPRSLGILSSSLRCSHFSWLCVSPGPECQGCTGAAQGRRRSGDSCV